MLDDKEVYIPGQFNIYCMSCNRKYKSSEIRKRWDGLLVCEEDWEPRHPQDFVRGVQEKSNILPFSYDVDGSESVVGACTLYNSQAISGIGAAGCAVSGMITFWENGGSRTPGYRDSTAGTLMLDTTGAPSPGTNTDVGGLPVVLNPAYHPQDKF